jgi:hypothetical protein
MVRALFDLCALAGFLYGVALLAFLFGGGA